MRMIDAFLAATLLAAPSTAMAADSAERARIEKAYAEKLQAEQVKASNDAIAARGHELLSDGAVQVLGNPAGDVSIVAFVDHQCPYTKAVEPRLAKFVRDDGNVKLIVKPFPILGKASRAAARAVQAAARQDKAKALHEALLAREGGLSRDLILEIAAKTGIDVGKLARDMDTPDVADAVMENFSQARSLKVTSTPTFIINGQLVTEPSAKIDFPAVAAAVRAKGK